MRLLCLHCRTITTASEDSPPLSGCPGCGSTAVPADADDTVTITLTTQELRVLTIWASNYAEAIKAQPNCAEAPKVVTGILDEIGRYTALPLSMRQEIADLRAEFGEVAVYRQDGTPTDI